MTSASSNPCQFPSCLEHALSFDTHCWEHISHDAFFSKLREGLKAVPKGEPILLNLKKAHLTGFDFSGLDMTGSEFSQTHISNSTFIGSKLSDSSLIGARISSSEFIGSDICRTNFTRAVLSSSSFCFSDLRGSYFVEAHFRDADFMGAVLFDCVLWNAHLSGALHLKQANFKNPDSKKIRPSYHLSEENIVGAYESYRSIKHYFYDNGLYEAGSWAARRELTMERKNFFQKRDLRYIPSLLMDLLSGYTEKPSRVILSSLIIVAIFGLAYFFLNIPMCTLENSSGRAGLWDSIYFSFITFTTVGYGDFTPRPVFWFRLLACAEAFSGPFMAGLYIFTLTRRYAAS